MKVKFVSLLFLFLILVGLVCGQISDYSIFTQWELYWGNPVIQHGLPGSWDVRYVGYSGVCVLFDEAEQIYKMWYSGATLSGGMKIGYAVSEDGLNWNKSMLNPVFSDPYCYSTYIPRVVIAEGEYKMYYTRYRRDWGNYCDIGLATSPDGINWVVSQQNPVLVPGTGFEATRVQPGTVTYDGTIFKMWYSGAPSHSGVGGASVGYATSYDGIHWEKYVGNPVISPGLPGTWDCNNIFGPTVLWDGGTYHMLYLGIQYPFYLMGHAYSSDGMNWTKSAWNPVFGPGSDGDWDDGVIHPGPLMLEDSKIKMWYTGSGKTTGLQQIGYAFIETCSKPSISLSDPICVNVGKGKGKMANKLTVRAEDCYSGAVEPDILAVEFFNQDGDPVNGNGLYDIVENDIYAYPNANGWTILVTAAATDAEGNSDTLTIEKSLIKCKK